MPAPLVVFRVESVLLGAYGLWRAMPLYAEPERMALLYAEPKLASGVYLSQTEWE